MYFDYAAATPLDPEVFEAMKPYMTSEFANPSAVYQAGQRARAAVDEARTKVAKFLNCQPTEVYFTGSGTESNNWAIKGIIEDEKVKNNIHIISSVTEHRSILETLKHCQQLYGIDVTPLPVNPEGLISLDNLKQAIRPNTALISIHFVNNEIGTVQPVEEIGQLCREKGILFHTDACQAAPYYPLDMKKLPIDLLTFNSSKIYGPKGVGVLYVREGVKISPLIDGGGQEFKLRSGTENVAGIVGLGKAVELIKLEQSLLAPCCAWSQNVRKIENLRNELWEMLQKEIPEVKLNGSWEHRSPNNLSVSFQGVDGDMLMKKLDLEGIAVSTTSACSSGISEPSHVLKALGTGTEKSSIRISLGKYTTNEEIECFLQILKKTL